MNPILIKNVNIVNEGKLLSGDILIRGERIEKIATSISTRSAVREINADRLFLLPGVIDDQVHFRKPAQRQPEIVLKIAKL